MGKTDNDKFFNDTYVPTASFSGTRYDGFTTGDLLAYTRSCFNLKASTTKASSTKELTDFLTDQWPSNDVKNALNRMRAVVVDALDWGPDVLIKILPDLDVAFFNGLLRNKIQVSWQDSLSIQAEEFPASRFDNDLGATVFDDVNSISHVYLNRRNICAKSNPRQAMLLTLVHELVVSTSASRKLSLPNNYSWWYSMPGITSYVPKP